MTSVHSFESNLLSPHKIAIFDLASLFQIGIVGANRSALLNVTRSVVNVRRLQCSDV
jgi:hypothetical protein